MLGANAFRVVFWNKVAAAASDPANQFLLFCRRQKQGRLSKHLFRKKGVV
jgi:hypothetical protein